MSQFFIDANGGGGSGPVETINSQPPVGFNFNFTSPDGSITITSAPGLITLESAGGGTGTPYAIWNTDGSGTPAWRTTTTITGSYQTTGGSLYMPYTNSAVTQGAIVYGPLGSGIQVMTCDAVNNFGCGPGVNTAVIAGGSNNLSFSIAGFALLTIGNANLGVGLNPFPGLVSGSQNVGLGCANSGNGVGDSYLSSESNNLLLNSAGVTGESNVARYGTQGSGAFQVNKCFIAGIVGVTTSNSEMVTINSSTGQLGVASIPGGTVTSVSGTTNRITSTGGTTPVIDISASYVGQSSITTLGTIGTGVWQGTVVGPTYGGTGVNNGALTITLASGGTGKVLTSDSSGNATWQAAAGGGITTINGNSGSATGSTVTFDASTDGSTTNFTATGSTVTLNFSDANNNVVLGKNDGGVGVGSYNVGLGPQVYSAGNVTGQRNVAVGYFALGSLGSGSYNLCFGTSGNSYTGAESNNIMMNNSGVNGESNVLRIGTGTGSGTTNLNKAFIAGINGIAVTGVPVIVSSSDQLGTGIVSNPVQPYFFAYLASTTSGLTGDGTDATVIFDTTLSNVGSIYNTSTGVFTAPVTGVYQISYQIISSGVSASNTSQSTTLFGSSRQIPNLFDGAYSISASGYSGQNGSVIIPMSTNETYQVQYVVSGSGTKNVNILADQFGTYFCAIKVA